MSHSDSHPSYFGRGVSLEPRKRPSLQVFGRQELCSLRSQYNFLHWGHWLRIKNIKYINPHFQTKIECLFFFCILVGSFSLLIIARRHSCWCGLPCTSFMKELPPSWCGNYKSLLRSLTVSLVSENSSKTLLLWTVLKFFWRYAFGLYVDVAALA